MIYLKLILAMVFWGGTFVAGKIIVQSMGVFSGAFCRFSLASLCLLWLSTRLEKGLPRLTWQQLKWVALMGLTGVFLYNAFFFLGLKLIPASRAALIIALNPIAIALSSALFFQEPLSRLKVIGIVTSLVGAAIVVAQGHPLQILSQGVQVGDLAMLACVVSWVSYTLASKRALTEVSSIVASTYACIIGAIGLLVPALIEGLIQTAPHFTLSSWLGVIYSAVFGTALAFTLYSDGIQALGAARAGIFINLVPPSAIVLAALILQEQITSSLMLGGSLIIAGVVCTNRG